MTWQDAVVSTRTHRLSRQEIADAFSSAAPPILSPEQFATLIGISVKTIYEWLARGRLDGAYRKRGKHVLLWRDRAVNILFNGKDWA
jgi:excisionase family DNA binding protein